MVETVKFNVGGRRFEVSRALVDEHSETMLGRLVSDTWTEDTEKEMFIDRDGDLFAHVLNFLRYGSIELPITVARSMFDREMDYYGINATSVADRISQASLAKIMDSLHAPVVETEKRLGTVKMNRDTFLLAAECFSRFCQQRLVPYLPADRKVIRISFGAKGTSPKLFYNTVSKVYDRGDTLFKGLVLAADVECKPAHGGCEYSVPLEAV